MEKIDAAQPISITLDGSNYILWAQAMTSFLKGKKLWRIITGDVIKPVKATEENQSKYEERLEDWDSKNHQVVTWIRNTSVTSISLQFGRFQNQNAPAKAIWDFLKDRYQSTGLSHQYQLLSQLDRMRQEPGQSINGFLSQIYAIWDQISLSEPSWTSTADAALFAAYRDQQRLIQFLMALTIDFEPVRASLLHRNPLPTLDQAISELLSEETRLGTLKSQSLDSALATHRRRDVQPSQSSGPPSQFPGSCTYCHSLSHELLRCPVRTCKHCHKTGPRHYQSDCWKNPNKQSHGSNSRGQSRNTYSQGSQSKSSYQYKSNIASRPAAAAPEDSDSPDSALTPQFSMTDVEAIIQQVLAKSGTPNDSSSPAPPEAPVLVDDHAPRLVEPTESPQPSISSPIETTTCSSDTSCSSEPLPLPSKRLVNHGISEELLERVKKVRMECYKMEREGFCNSNKAVKMMNELVAKKSDEKMENIDWEDVFFLTEENQSEWPSKTPGFKSRINASLLPSKQEVRGGGGGGGGGANCQEQPPLSSYGEYRSELKKLAEKVMEVMDENLGLPKGFIKNAFNGEDGGDNAFFCTKVAHYPPCPHREMITGLRAHTDAGGVILFFQDDEATIAPAPQLVEKVNQEEDQGYPKFVFGDYMSVYAGQKFLPKEPRFHSVKAM
ncbi:hypothetical protein RHSIM_Rhsim11G0068500 [Rhododendron simsii]|uniref:Uncharacterized protein n=1 Tax=Rhododendron simsii TaxID=118357 RepID=A0A834G5X3_RHOSS|nr:hypothetical protein RHSIM_Rhsim11G0068500 [Rhododendron simsii]